VFVEDGDEDDADEEFGDDLSFEAFAVVVRSNDEDKGDEVDVLC
jgi:hypothetical protein